MTEDGKVHPEAEVIPLWKVEEGRDYVLLISTVAGAWRYMIGDTIRFTNKDKHEMVITGRTKHFLNEEYIHKWYLGSDDPIDPQDAAKTLDRLLQDMNKNYRAARSKALKDVVVAVVPTHTFYRWNEATRKKADR